MNTNEHDSDPRAQLRRKLVAVLLGEAAPEEAAEVERALTSDPELAAERERLAATIGLVAGLQGADAAEHLSPAAASRLADAAARRASAADAADAGGPRPLAGPQPVRRAWYASPVLRMAAMVAVLVGAFAAWRSMQEQDLAPAEELHASLEKQAREESPARGGRGAPSPASRPEASVPQASQSAPADGSASTVLFDAPLVEAEEPPASEPAPGSVESRFGFGAAKGGVPQGGGAPGSETDLYLGQQLRLLDELQGQADDKSRPQELFVGSITTAEAPDAAGVEIQLGLKPSHSKHEGAVDGGRGVTGLPAAPTAASPSSPGPPGAASGGEKASRGFYGSDPGDARARAETRMGAALTPAAGEPPAVGDFDAEVAQGAVVLGRQAALGYADSEEVEALERLRGLGYVSDPDAADDRFGETSAGYRRYSEDFYLRQRQLTPEQRQALIDQLIHSCRRRPQERPRDMFYRWWGDNAFEVARHDALSTFSVDVDTASYTLARRYLAERMLPEKAQVRTEEFVNYFKGDVPPPSEETFRIATELAPSLFSRSPDTWMLRVAIRGREVAREERKPLALTFVVDVSGSMKEQSRLELVKHAMRLLVGELDARDSLSIVAFTNDARLVLPMTSARHRGLIESAIHPLQPEGGTNVQAGLRMGYEAALAGLASEANNRVVLLSDGVGNIGETDAQALNQEVERQRRSGIYLNTVGVGMNNHNDAFLEQLADKGDGICNYVDDEREARRALVENFTGAFEPIARDAKIQVEFDPAQVERYRLLGYENRAIADQDFRNDAVDAGEVGSGHQVVALYEVVRTGRSDPETPLATVRLRWKPPYREIASNQMEDVPATEMAQPVHAREAAASYAATSAGYRRSVLVGQLAEFLRRSIHARDDSFETLLDQARKLAPELADPDFDEFVQMVERTVELISAEWGRYDRVARRLDALRMQHYLHAQLEDLAADLDRARLEQIDRQIQDLEAEVRELLNDPEGVRTR